MRSSRSPLARHLLPFSLLALLATSCASGASSGEPAAAGRYASAPAIAIDTTKTYSASLVTTKGTIELSLDARAAPVTVNNFVFLAREKFYDGLTFHRVVPGFVVQGGDPAGDGPAAGSRSPTRPAASSTSTARSRWPSRQRQLRGHQFTSRWVRNTASTAATPCSVQW